MQKSAKSANQLHNLIRLTPALMRYLAVPHTTCVSEILADEKVT